MRTLVRSLTSCAVLLTLTAAAIAQDAREPESQANAIFRVTADPKSGLANEELLWRMVNNGPAIAQRALLIVSNELKLSPPPDVKAFRIEATNWNEFNHGGQKADVHRNEASGVGLVHVSVKSFDERMAASRLLNKVREALQEALHRLDTDHTAREQSRAEVRARVEKLGEELERKRSELMALAAHHKIEIEPELQAQKRLRLETELQSLKVQLAGLKARQKIIEQQIGKLSKLGENDKFSAAQQAALRALQSRVDAQRMVLQKVVEAVKTQSITISERATAQAQLAEAEAELVKYQAAVADEAGGARIAQLSERLDDAAIEIVELEVRGEAVEKLYQDAQANSAHVAMKRIEVELLENHYRAATEELQKLEVELERYTPPRVDLIEL